MTIDGNGDTGTNRMLLHSAETTASYRSVKSVYYRKWKIGKNLFLRNGRVKQTSYRSIHMQVYYGKV